MMKAIGLIRVSTLVQDLQQQTEVVKNEMIKDGYRFPDDIILIANTESAVKLSEEERQGLNKMKAQIENDPSINCVYVFELSRLSRRPEVLYSVRDWLIAHNVNLIVLKPYMKLLEDGRLSETASIMFGIFGAMSEQEGYIRKERMKRGKMKAQLEGKSLGNWLPIGYTTDNERHIIIDEEKAQLVRKIFDMCLYEDKSTTTIARELSDRGEFITQSTIHGHSSSIRNILRNTAYIGVAPFNKKDNKTNYNRYPRIIDDAVFFRVQDLLSSRKKLPKTEHKNIYYCKGLLKDKISGYVLRAAPAVASYCYHSDRSDPIQYKSISVPINLFDSFIWHLTKEFTKGNSTINTQKYKTELKNKLSTLQKKIETGKERIKELSEREERIQARIISGKMKESMGDAMLEGIYSAQNETRDNIVTWEKEYNKLFVLKVKYAGRLVEVNNVDEITDDSERYKLIHEVIKEVLIEKGGDRLEPGRKRKRGLGVKYGIMDVLFQDEHTENYKFNSYTKKCFTLDDVEIPFEYLFRIKGQQHQPDYQIKNKKWRDEHKKK